MDKQYVTVVTDDRGRPQLIRDPSQPLSAGGLGSWGDTNRVMEPAPHLADQHDDPHKAGSIIVRRDDRGWYVLWGKCPYCPVSGEENVEDTLDSNDTATWFVCEACLDQMEEER